MLAPTKLTKWMCEVLAKNMRHADRLECEAVGHSPYQALLAGLRSGPAVAVLRTPVEEGDVVGAFGVNLSERVIWSLWADGLKWQEQLGILKHTPDAVRGLVALCDDRQLHNLVDIRNKVAIEWLERSGCFQINPTIEQIGGESYLRFTTIQGRP